MPSIGGFIMVLPIKIKEKTSVILALKKLGYVVIPESATDVIAESQAKGDNLLDSFRK